MLLAFATLAVGGKLGDIPCSCSCTEPNKRNPSISLFIDITGVVNVTTSISVVFVAITYYAMIFIFF